MRRLELLFIYTLVIGSIRVCAQTDVPWHCADEALGILQRQMDPGFARRQEMVDLQFRDYMNSLRGRNKPVFNGRVTADSVYTIPVVIHVVHPAGEAYGTGTNISYAQIRSQLQALNAAFGRNYPAYNGQSHPAYAQDTRIRFCLARVTGDTASWYAGPGGIEYGVKRYVGTHAEYDHDINVTAAAQLLKLTHPSPNSFPFDKYLNIWVVKSIGGENIMGYAPRPINSAYPLDGVVIRADIFGDNTAGTQVFSLGFGLTQGKVLAHEIGHYLNLYHIFQGGCAGANPSGAATDACDLNGDMICDIEPAVTQNIFCTGNMPNTCNANYNAGTTDLDMINDYMSYADDDCMNTFTLNQAQRMWATLNLQRQSIWQPANLVATGVLGTNGCVPSYLNAQINTDNAVYCVSKPIVFSNPTPGNTANNFEWKFPGGTPASGNSRSVSVVYNTPGNYKAILKISDGLNSRTDSLLFTILDCRLDSSLLFMSHWYFGNYCSLDFSSGSPIQTNTALVNHTMTSESSYPGQIPFVAATASVSDSSGNLLFYSNAVNVWNKNHQRISTVPIFGKADVNASTGVCYVPFPGQPGKYFIVGAAADLFTGPGRIRYVLVDLNRDTVSAYEEFRHPAIASKFSEFLTVVPHCNGKDYWIITKGYGMDDRRFFSFLVTEAGIDPLQAPVISINIAHPGYQGSGNQLKSNHQGNKLILAAAQGSEGMEAGALYDFDNATGAVKNERKIPNVPGYNNIQTGTAFSSNDEFFYLMRSSNLQTNGLPYWLFQYRVSDMKYNIINAPGFYFAAAFQLGPDKQIYIGQQGNTLGRISNPDVWGGATVNGSFLNTSLLNPQIISGVSLPAFIDARRPTPTRPDFSATAVNCNTYRFSSICFDNYTATWDFGDGSPTQAGSVVTHNYARTGEIQVRLTLSNGTITYGSTIKKIFIVPLSASITGPDNICTNDNFPSQYFAPVIPDVDYRWTVFNGRISGPDNAPFVDVKWNASGGTGTISLEIVKDGCRFIANKTIGIIPGPDFKWILPDSVCSYDSSFLLKASPEGGSFAGSGVTGNVFDPALAGVGKHRITYTYSNELTCIGQIEKIIKVGRCNIPGGECEAILNSIDVAPNPVHDVLQLRSVYALKYAVVYNAAGQKVAAGQLIKNGIHLPLVAPGLYIVLVYCENNKSYRSFRFLKLN